MRYGAGAALTPRSGEWWFTSWKILPRVWPLTEGAGVTVAVLSDGVEPTEDFLVGSVIQGPDFTRSGRTARSRYYGVMGTSLAGLIVGHGVSFYPGQVTRDVYGIAPGARVLAVRVTLSPGDPLWSDSKVTTRLPDAIAARGQLQQRSLFTVTEEAFRLPQLCQ